MARSHIPVEVGYTDSIGFAERAGVSTVTVSRWRRIGFGPKPIYLTPRTVRYRISEIDEFLNGGSAHTTSAADDHACPECGQEVCA